MTEKFDMNNMSELDDTMRRQLLEPYETLKSIGFREGTVLADIGCGTGIFTLPAAVIGGKGAKIYAVDIADEMLVEVKKRADAEGFENVETIKSSEYDFILKSGSVDFVLLCTVLHEIENKVLFLKEAKRICRSGGKIAVIEFNSVQKGFGPPLAHRIAAEQVSLLFSGLDLKVSEQLDLNGVFYAVSAVKP